MKLKDYQIDVLDALSTYLAKLDATRRDAEDFAEFQRSKGKDAAPTDFCRDTWDALKPALPQAVLPDGTRLVRDHVGRLDGRKRPIPNLCLKIPTGGGKTLLAALSIDKINAEYFKAQTGLVLWVVPSEAIYAQTWRTLADREHPYRQMLERASGGRVKMLEKNDSFTRQDVESHLCVMLIMLQAGAVREESKEGRKMFRDTGKYPSFFPDEDDANANAATLRDHPDLELNGEGEDALAAGSLCIRQSLANVLRLTRPLVVIDEGHKAYSATALDFIARHNPRFILELSATPNAREHISNILVNVTGTALKDEEMIKLPINVINEGGGDWKHALAAAKDQLDKLGKLAKKVKNNEDRYVRPILLIRVELTGEEQRDKGLVHAEDVRTYLQDKLGVPPEQIKVKSASKDELAEVDRNPAYQRKGLLSELCPVRYIITKDALREGWDCPFAYVLAALSRTTAATTMTQMIGRVLRQPGAKRTGVDALNECYVFTHDQDVQEAIDSVRKGLQDEGMGDLVASVRSGNAGSAVGAKRETLKRREAFKGVRVFMPKVLSRHYKTREWRPFDYERDLLPRLKWDGFAFSGHDTFTPDSKAGIERTQARVDLDAPGSKATAPKVEKAESAEDADIALDIPSLARQLLDVVPNPWQGARIIGQAVESLRVRGFAEDRIFANRLALVKEVKDDLRMQLNAAGEAEFRGMLAAGELSFALVSGNDPDLNWELAQTLSVDVPENDRPLARKNGTPIEKSFLEPVYQTQLNGLERDVAWYLDGDAAVKWWHRIAVRQDWHLQGWQRNRIYPDFLACLHGKGDGSVRFTVLETKGLHLAGSEDTEYKRRLFQVLTQHSQTAVPAGELILEHGKQSIRFEMLLENNWMQTIAPALQVPASRAGVPDAAIGRGKSRRMK